MIKTGPFLVVGCKFLARLKYLILLGFLHCTYFMAALNFQLLSILLKTLEFWLIAKTLVISNIYKTWHGV